MTDYTAEMDQIRRAKSLDDIQEIARKLSAKASSEGGILYSRDVGKVESMQIAIELAEKTGLPIINKTPRAEFLANIDVRQGIERTASNIFKKQGYDADTAEKLSIDFQYGTPNPTTQFTSLDNCLWGEASREFASSLRGDIKVVASDANMERVFGQVELPAILNNPNIKTLAGQPIADLRTIAAKDGTQALLQPVQAQFIDAAPQGIYKSPALFYDKKSPIALSKEFANTMGVDARGFASAVNLSTSGSVVRADIGMAVDVARNEAAVAARTITPMVAGTAGLDPSKSADPVSPIDPALSPAKAGLGLKAGAAVEVVGAAAFVYDTANTVRDTSTLLNQGNTTGAQSALLHFGGRTLGMAAGMELGATVGAAAGVETGPGALVTGAVGGIVGAVGGNWVANQIDQHHIYHQTDPAGRDWTFNPDYAERGWQGIAPNIDPTTGKLNGMQVVTADPALSDRLNYQASGTAVELALSAPRPAQDPYTQPATDHDTPSLEPADWVRDPQSRAWSRTITTDIDEHGLKSTRIEMADATKTTQLNQAAQHTIEDNVANSPHGIAQRYHMAYEQFDWQRHGAMPAVVTDKLQTPDTTLQASDGHTYTRDANHQWTTPGMLWGSNVATGNVRDELENTQLTRQLADQTAAGVVAADRQRHAAQQNTATPAAAVAPQAIAPPTLDQPTHPAHTLFKQAQAGVYALDASKGRSPDQRSDNLSAALVVAAQRDGLTHINHVVLSEDAKRVFAIQGELSSPLKRYAGVDTVAAVNTPIAQSSAASTQVVQQQTQQQDAQQQQTQQQVQTAKQAGPTR